MLRHTLVLLFLPLAAFADDPFACVDPDFVDAFLGNWHSGSPRYSTELPADTPDVALPADFELVGSMTAGASVTIAYKSETEAEIALSESVESLRGAGWKDAEFGYDYLRGFRTGSTPLMAMLCHPSQASVLSMESRKRTGRTLLTVSVYPQQGQMTCGESLDVESRFDMPLQKYIPNLVVPDGARVHDNGSGGGNDEYNTSVVLTTTLSREALLRHFDDQIRTQGWVADSAWSGGMTAGTVWTRNGPNDGPLVGTLRIAEASGGVFNARFTVISVVPETYVGGNISSTLTCN